MNIARFSVDNRVLVNLLMWSILGFGVAAFVTLPKDVFPDVTSQRITITTIYRGASAADVERLVSAPIEEELERLSEIEEIDSTSREGLSTIVCKLVPEIDDAEELIDEVRAAVDKVTDLPDSAEDPDVAVLELTLPVIMVSVYGEASELARREIAEQLEDLLGQIPGTGAVRITGVRDREVWVEVDPLLAEAHDLTLAEVANAVGRANLTLPGGTLTTPSGELLVRVVGERADALDLSKLALRSDAGGRELLLSDVARLRDTFEESLTLARYDGTRSTNLLVTKTQDGDFISIAEDVRRLIAAYEPPPGISVGVFNDFSTYINNRLRVMVDAGVIGFVMVMATLMLFLTARISLVTAMGIPISLCGAAIFLQVSGTSINMISLFAMIIVLGMLVDDAIVVAENVYRYMEEGMPPREAALHGAQEVVLPVFAAVSTTMAAFLPLLLAKGEIGKFIRVIPIVVTAALVFSLLESFVILPSHLAEWIPPPRRHTQQSSAFKRAARLYERFITSAYDHRYVSAIVAFCVLITLVIAAFKVLPPFQLFTDFEAKSFYVNVEAPASAGLEDTERLVAPVERACMKIPSTELLSVTTSVGMRLDTATGRPDLRRNIAQLTVELVEFEFRERTIDQIFDDLRKEIGQITGLVSIELLKASAGPTGPAIEVIFEGEDLETLDGITDEAVTFLSELPGVKDARDDFVPGKEEVRMSVTDAGRALGFDERSLIAQVGGAIDGVVASEIRTTKDDIEVRVKYPESFRHDPRAVKTMRLRAPRGGWVNFDEVAAIERAPGLYQVRRADGARAIGVTADVDRSVSSPLEATRALQEHFDGLEERRPGYRMRIKGERADTEESMVSLLKAFIVGAVLIYGIIASLFRSYAQAFAVILAVPFGWTGVIFGHLVMWEPLGFMSLLGTVALTGIVVNDSVVLVDFINRRRRAGTERGAAVIEASRVRLRPVLLTSITTIAGLFSLAFFSTGQAKFMAPMAISVVWGLTTSTILTLVVVPCFYSIIDDFTGWTARATGRGKSANQPSARG